MIYRLVIRDEPTPDNTVEVWLKKDTMGNVLVLSKKRDVQQCEAVLNTEGEISIVGNGNFKKNTQMSVKGGRE